MDYTCKIVNTPYHIRNGVCHAPILLSVPSHQPKLLIRALSLMPPDPCVQISVRSNAMVWQRKTIVQTS